MTHTTAPLVSYDGIKLFSQSWKRKDSIANLVIIHGYAEHSSRYEWVANKFHENKINVHTFDLRGHGQSEGERAYISSFDQYLKDVHLFIEGLELENPMFMLGHSMGGLIVTSYLSEHSDTNCSGAILSAPALKIGDDISPLLVKVSSLLSAIFPRLKATTLDTQYISRDPEVVEQYDNDPLIYHSGVKARLGAEMISSMIKVRERYSNFTFPVLLMHGTGDKLTDPKGSQWMVDEISSTDKKLELLPGLYHEILKELEKEEVIDKMLSWIIERV